MKRWAWILCGILLMGTGGKTGEDLETLKPVCLLEVSWKKGSVMLRTDTGDYGTGASLQSALKDMEETSSGRIFLETADFLLLEGNAEALLPEIWEKLRPAVRVCRTEEKLDLRQAAEYLSVHLPETTLGGMEREGDIPPELIKEGERLKFNEKPGKAK